MKMKASGAKPSERTASAMVDPHAISCVVPLIITFALMVLDVVTLILLFLLR